MADELDYSDRVFHVELLRGGMNRLLLRSNRSDHQDLRIEVLFMNVKYLAIASILEGLTVKDRGSLSIASDLVPWRLEPFEESHVYELETSRATGWVVAGSATVDESALGPADASVFPLM